jgi:hypothetical protein
MYTWIWQWTCEVCGHIWQVIPSRVFPERVTFQPVCPGCGGKPSREWVNTKEDKHDYHRCQ